MLKTLFRIGKYLLGFLMLFAAFYAVELFAYSMLQPGDRLGLRFGIMWALLLAGLIYAIPKKIGRIVFGIVYFVIALWTLAQVGYFRVFNKLMWFSSIFFADEGATFLGDVISSFGANWWIGGAVLIGIGVAVIIFYPKSPKKLWKLGLLAPVVYSIICLCILPQEIFIRDEGVWGVRSEYEQVSSQTAVYETMYDAKKLYNLCGIYHTTWRDLWVNCLYPLTPAYQTELKSQRSRIDTYFEARGTHQDNEMTGIFEGKNVVLVLMESMDDYMITEEDTPTICSLMDEGIVFTDFYTPGYGSARTLNSEFCMNTGIYLPTTGKYVFDYVTNDYSQSIASQLTDEGYNSLVFHYNTPKFYSRGVFEPALGYEEYVSYEDYTDDEEALYSEVLLFDNQALNDRFFREGQTFNTIITRSAHLSYKYNEVLSYRALKQYPQYRGMYGSEEEDCARVKAKLVDDMFARLFAELDAHGQLENTVIIAMTDHYTYGYKNTEELLELSGVTDPLLLEKTPCFIWSADGPSLTVDKTLNTADLLPTVMNMMGITDVQYLGQDAFDPSYQGYAIFPDGTWITGGVKSTASTLTEEENRKMDALAAEFIQISNLMLTSDYYKE